MMETYIKKDAIIQAIQCKGNRYGLKDWSRGKIVPSPVLEPTPDNPSGYYVQIYNSKGIETAGEGDYIIRDAHGEFSSCKQYIFEKTYEKVEYVKGELR